MGQKLRRWVAHSLAAIVLVSGALITPGTVLCIGPGHHCHLENPIGDSCNTRLPARDQSGPNVPDGCPKGSKDISLSVPALSSGKGIAGFLYSSPLAVTAGYVVVWTLSRAAPSFTEGVRTGTPQRSTTILRC